MPRSAVHVAPPRTPFDDDDDTALPHEDEAAYMRAEVLPTTDELLELSGEDTLDQIREVVLRERGLREVGSLLRQLPRLEVLSLSNNCLHSLVGWPPLPELTVLNLNFNRLSSLEPLTVCMRLTKLYAASNRVGAIGSLAACTELRCLSLFRNRISSLDAAINTLAALPHLTELDLGANPCALGPAYRHRLVAALPTLSSLDGDTLTELDYEIAVGFLEGESPADAHGGAAAGARGEQSGGSGGSDERSRAPTLRAGGEGGSVASSSSGSLGGGLTGIRRGVADVLVLDDDDHHQGRAYGAPSGAQPPSAPRGDGGFDRALGGAHGRRLESEEEDDDDDRGRGTGGPMDAVAAAMAAAAAAADAAEWQMAGGAGGGFAGEEGGMGGMEDSYGAHRPTSAAGRPGTASRLHTAFGSHPVTGLPVRPNGALNAFAPRPGTASARPGTATTTRLESAYTRLGTASGARPGTATNGRPGTATGGSGERPPMVSGSVREASLFRDPFLNTNPILLEYLSQAEIEKHAQGASSSRGSSRGGSRGGDGRGDGLSVGYREEAVGESGSALGPAYIPKGACLSLPDGTAAGVISLRRPMVERLRLTAITMERNQEVSIEIEYLLSTSEDL